jgi:hypothetical protein
MFALSARRPRYDEGESLDLPQRDVTTLALELASVLPLQHGMIEHPRGADEIDPMSSEIVVPPGFIPLEHSRPQHSLSAASGPWERRSLCTARGRLARECKREGVPSGPLRGQILLP